MTTKTDYINQIANDLIYDESIRSGIYKSKSSPDSPYQEFYHHAHGDLLPDDYRYTMIYDIINSLNNTDNLENYDDLSELEQLIPTYTSDLLNWIASNNTRHTYVDDFREEFGPQSTIIKEISGGYLMELQETYNLITNYLDENCDNDDDDN
jgi:hypothetical protein